VSLEGIQPSSLCPQPLRLPPLQLPPTREQERAAANLYDQVRAKGYDEQDAQRLSGVARAVDVRYDDPCDTWFLTFDDTKTWVRIEASTRDEARAYAAHTYGTDWTELLADVVFNPDLYPGGETDHVRIEPRS
jgi:hypothetical protein